MEGKRLRPGDSALSGNSECDNGFAGDAGVEAVGDAVTAVDEEFDDGVVDEDMQAGLCGEALGELDVEFVDPEGEGVLVFVGADFEDRAGGVGDAVGSGFAGVCGLEDAEELLTGVG